MHIMLRLTAAAIPLLAVLLAGLSLAADEPVPVLNLPGAGTDPDAIDYDRLPVLTGEHAIVNPAARGPHSRPVDQLHMADLRLNLHNYLVHYDGRYWCLWSDGPKVEDYPTQEMKYSTSEDGLTWSPARSVTGTPEEPYAWIARGLWVRDGELLALGAHYRGHGAFGPPEKKKRLFPYFSGWLTAA